jgi:hypothetical protein
MGFLAEQTAAIGASRAAKHDISGCFMAIALPLVAWYHLCQAVGRASLSRSG